MAFVICSIPFCPYEQEGFNADEWDDEDEDEDEGW